MRGNFASTIGNAASFGSGGLCVYLLEELDVLNIRFTYAVLTVLLLVYLWLEATRIRRIHRERWLLNPAIFCALMTFVMGYGLTNMLFFMPPESISFLGVLPEVLPAMVKHQYLVLLGALALFLGYWSPLAVWLSRPVAVANFQRYFLPGTDVLKFWAIPALVAVSVGVRLYAIRQGLYGFGSSNEAQIEAAHYAQYVILVGNFGKLALTIVALQYYGSGATQRTGFWLVGIVLVEVAFGFLSGFKSAVVTPFVMVGFCQYLRTGKLPINWVVLMVIGIVIAYAVIEPFRMERQKYIGELSSTTVIVDMMIRSVSDSSSAPVANQTKSTVLSIASRMNLSYIGSFGIEYADAYPELPEGSPAFLEDILLAPVYAVIPRFLWDSKPIVTLGLWYNQVVLGGYDTTSIAMGPFAYLYFTGGYLAVGIVFFFIGFLQRSLLFLCAPSHFLTGGVVFLIMLSVLSSVDSRVGSILIALFRNLPIQLLLLHILFRRRVPRNPIEA
jgi:hypothetical protein